MQAVGSEVIQFLGRQLAGDLIINPAVDCMMYKCAQWLQIIAHVLQK